MTTPTQLILLIPLSVYLFPSPSPTLTSSLPHTSSIIFSLHPFTLHLLNSPPSSPRPISPLLHSLYTLYISSNPFPSPYTPPPSSLHSSSLLPTLLLPTLLLPPPYTPPSSSLHSSSLLPTLLLPPPYTPPPSSLHSSSLLPTLLLPPPYTPPPSSLHSSSLLPTLLLPPPYTPPPSSLHSSSLLPTLLLPPPYTPPPSSLHSSLLPTLLLPPPYTPPPSSLHSSSLLPTLLLPPPYTPPPSSLHSSSLLPTLLLPPPYTPPPSSLHSSSLLPTLLLPPPYTPPPSSYTHLLWFPSRRGVCAWRDCEQPSEILENFCRLHNFPEPEWRGDRVVVVDGVIHDLTVYGEQPYKCHLLLFQCCACALYTGSPPPPLPTPHIRTRKDPFCRPWFREGAYCTLCPAVPGAGAGARARGDQDTLQPSPTWDIPGNPWQPDVCVTRVKCWVIRRKKRVLGVLLEASLLMCTLFFHIYFHLQWVILIPS